MKSQVEQQPDNHNRSKRHRDPCRSKRFNEEDDDQNGAGYADDQRCRDIFIDDGQPEDWLRRLAQNESL